MKQHLIMLITMILSCYGASASDGIASPLRSQRVPPLASDHVGVSDMSMITDSIVQASEGGDAFEFQDVVWETPSTPYPNHQESRALFESGSVQQHRQNDNPKPQNIETTTNGNDQQQQGSRQGDFVQLRSARELNHYPIDDSAPGSPAQQNFWKQMGIFAELQQHIYEYSDEIASLFRMFDSPEDRMDILGFENYEEMNRVHPTKQQKIQHFRERIQSGRFHVGIYFGTRAYYPGKFIERIHVEDRPSSIQRTIINWNALAGFDNLEYLTLKYLQMPFSMDDIQKVPATVTELVIPGNLWKNANEDVDLNLFPKGLESFSANDCQGMHGRLKFHAPHAKLRLQTVSVEGTGILLDVNQGTILPMQFRTLKTHRNVSGEKIQMLKDKGVMVLIDRYGS